MILSLNSIFDNVKTKDKIKIAIAAAEELNVLQLIKEAEDLNIADFILVGDESKIREITVKDNIEIASTIVNEPNNQNAAEKAVELVKIGETKAIMKGNIHTGTFMKAVLNKEKGLNVGKLISQISVFDKEYSEGLQLLTDCAMAIAPDVQAKKQIIENAISIALKIGYKKPRVAILSALEIINFDIKDTIDAAILSKMADRGQIKNAIVDGPYALDNAISPEAAKIKGNKGDVAGQADILLAPNLQVGNVLTKALTYYAHKEVASVIVGAEAPIIMTSRTDAVKNKLLSIALASYVA